MDPQPLTPEQWQQISSVLGMLTLAFLSALVAAPALLTAHAIIPSALGTETIPAKFAVLRPVLYIVGTIGVLGIVFFFVLAGTQMDWLMIYTRYWQ